MCLGVLRWVYGNQVDVLVGLVHLLDFFVIFLPKTEVCIFFFFFFAFIGAS